MWGILNTPPPFLDGSIGGSISLGVTLETPLPIYGEYESRCIPEVLSKTSVRKMCAVRNGQELSHVERMGTFSPFKLKVFRCSECPSV